MRVRDIRLTTTDRTIELSGAVNDYRLWFRFPGDFVVQPRADAFLAVALLPAMMAGEPLEIDSNHPVSPKLLEGIQQLQEIYHCWNPALKKVAISASASPATVANRGIASFFSGGVDGTYTALKHAEITHVILINGFDFFLDASAFSQAVDRNTIFAARLGKTLVPVETNYIQFNQACGPSRNISFGSCLGSIALALAFHRNYVPSAFDYRTLHPDGAHPLTDPLFSSEATQIVHDGCEASRAEKTAKIFEHQAVAQNLRVCWADMNRNCGRCNKCLRTRVALRALGISGEAFEDLSSLDDLRKWYLTGPREQDFLLENLRLAERRGDREMAGILRRFARRNDLKRLAVEADRLFLGGVLKRIKHLFVKPERLRVGPFPDPNYPP